MTIIGVISLLAAMFGLHNFGSHDPSARADLFSACLSVIGFGGLMFGFTNSQAYGFAAPVTWGPMTVGLIGIAWFVLRNLRAGRRYRAAAGATDRRAPAATAGSGRAQEPFVHHRHHHGVAGVLRLQFDPGHHAALYPDRPRLFGHDERPDHAAGGIGQCVSQFFGGRAMDRFGARPVALFGSIVLTLGTLGMSLVSMDTWIWWVSICQFIRQIGMGFLLMPITTWSLNCLDGPDEVSAGSSVTNTARQIAGAVGAPVMVILMETFAALHERNGASAAASVFGIQWALRISTLLCVAMVLMVLFGVKGDGAGRTRDIISLRTLRERRRDRVR